VYSPKSSTAKILLLSVRKASRFNGSQSQSAVDFIYQSFPTLPSARLLHRCGIAITGFAGSGQKPAESINHLWEITMRKVTVKLEMRIVMLVDEGIEISEVVNELDYKVNDTTTAADILDTEITDYEVVDSK